MKFSDYLHSQETWTRSEIAKHQARREQTLKRYNEACEKKEKLEKLTRETASMGLEIDAASSRAQCAELVTQIAALRAELKAHEQAYTTAVRSEEPDSRQRLERLRQLGDRLGLDEVPEIESSDKILSWPGAQLVFEGDAVSHCRLWLGEESRPIWQKSLPVYSNIPRMRRSAVPSDLGWVPNDWLPVKPPACELKIGQSIPLLPAPTVPLAQLYYIVCEQAFRPLLPDFPELGAPERSLLAHLESAFANQMVDLDAETEPLPGLKAAVMAVTQPADEVTYQPGPPPQTSVQIEQALKPSFRALIDAPWSDQTTGLHAKLKYYCEQGERPRFHNLSTTGAYGFRLRTRDHSWISGRLYLVPETFAYEPAAGPVPEVCNRYSRECLRLGRLIVGIDGEKRDW